MSLDPSFGPTVTPDRAAVGLLCASINHFSHVPVGFVSLVVQLCLRPTLPKTFGLGEPAFGKSCALGDTRKCV